ncbi:AraC family transcriptional regulator [Roseibium sp. Sym1]|uniref:AraC family transcriptional regulator n=1 Tax=Roseibium sp. Sym1 TaxID=3016006 RepID=UPI0022B4FA19|nr:AraC family transcriptional regulator [Roseibium sp. Sym1]
MSQSPSSATTPVSGPPVSLDPLGEILHLLQLTGTFYCVPELSAPWGIAVPDLDRQLVLIAVTEGGCRVDLGNAEELVLSAGQLLLLPHGRPVDLRDAPGSALTPLFDIPAIRHSPHFETMVHGGGGAVTRMTCGVLRVDHAAADRLVSLLPNAILLDSFKPRAGDWVNQTLTYLAEEAREPRPGGETVLTRLTDILVVQAIRAWLDSTGDQATGWLAAMRDPKIGRALQAFHQAPRFGWSVGGLATVAGMSRSAFAARFKHLTGEGVMQYAGRWRMRLAQTELQRTSRPIAEIAAQAGYESEAAFSRAFKKVTGRTPGSMRKGNIRE